MKRTTILSVIGTVAVLPVLTAQEPAPRPEGAMVTTRAFVNGQEVPSPGKGVLINIAEVAPVKDVSCCSNPDCTCGPSPKVCECTAEKVCGPNNEAPQADKPCDKPAASPECGMTPAHPQFVVNAQPVAPGSTPPGTMKMYVNGQEVKPTAAPPCKGKPAAAPECGMTPAHPQFVVNAQPVAPGSTPPGTMKMYVNGQEVKPMAAPDCGKKCCAPRPSKKVIRAVKLRMAAPQPSPGDMPPCGKARPFDVPACGNLPPCAHLQGRVMPTHAKARNHARPVAPWGPGRGPVRKASEAPAAPQAVRVIINGVETIIPLVDEGVNITIKPL